MYRHSYNNKNVHIKFSAHDVSGITFIRQSQNRKFEKPDNLKVLGSNKTKGPKQDSPQSD